MSVSDRQLNKVGKINLFPIFTVTSATSKLTYMVVQPLFKHPGQLPASQERTRERPHASPAREGHIEAPFPTEAEEFKQQRGTKQILEVKHITAEMQSPCMDLTS